MDIKNQQSKIKLIIIVIDYKRIFQKINTKHTIQRDQKAMAPIQFLINIISLSAGIFVIYWGKNGNFDNTIQQTFQNRKINTIQAQADHLADIAYLYAIYILIVSFITQIIGFFKKQYNTAISNQSKIGSNLHKIISNSSQHFLIFMSIYVYLLQKKGIGLKSDYILLFPFWFLIARIGSVVQVILTQILKNKFKFSYFGFTLTVIPYLFMIGQIFGYRLINMI